MATHAQLVPDVAPPDPGRRRRRIILASFLGVLLGVGGGFGYFYWRTTASLRAALPQWPPPREGELDALVSKAIVAERTKVSQHPFSSAAWGRLGMVFFAHGYEGEAAACFIQAEKLDPKEPRWPYLHGVVLIHSDMEAAIQKIERAADLCDQSNLVPRVRLGELLFKLNRFDQAERQYEAVLVSDRNNARAHLGLARLCAQRGESDKSFEHLEYSVHAPVGSRGSHELLAELNERRGDQTKADEHRRAAESVQRRTWPDPFVDEAKRLQTGLQRLLEVSAHLLLEDRINDAMKLLEKAIQEYPESQRAFVLLAKAYAKQKDWSAAEETLRCALMISSEYVEGQYLLGMVLTEKRDDRAAAECFLKSTELKPDFAEAYYHLGVCRDRLHDRQGAIAALRTALRCQPEMAHAHRMLGEMLAQERRAFEAMVHIQAALHYKEDDAKAKELLKEILPRASFPLFVP